MVAQVLPWPRAPPPRWARCPGDIAGLCLQRASYDWNHRAGMMGRGKGFLRPAWKATAVGTHSGAEQTQNPCRNAAHKILHSRSPQATNQGPGSRGVQNGVKVSDRALALPSGCPGLRVPRSLAVNLPPVYALISALCICGGGACTAAPRSPACLDHSL